MQNMNSYQSNLPVGHYSRTPGFPLQPQQPFQPMGIPAPTYTVNNDVVKLLSVLFQGKVCIYIDKFKNKQKLISRFEAETYIGNYYPMMLFSPFDANGHLYEYISMEYVIKWFEAEDGFSKFEFRYPKDDKEKNEIIKTIIAQNMTFTNVTITGNLSSILSTGTFSGPISTTNATSGVPTI
jgi:hypothetical protein